MSGARTLLTSARETFKQAAGAATTGESAEMASLR